ncbi:MAG TPA: hypothetical protein VH134_14215 [Candidatus Dormibacteraeota bacterium]|nr:hypothetical protein [Candidatus Dormibacteraeota bacterium]
MVGRTRVAVVAVAAAATACAPASRVAPAATVAVHGVVHAPDGSPAVGLRVGLVKQLDAGELLGGVFVIGVSLGLACFGGGPATPDICSHQPSSVTGRDGRFRFSLNGGDTQNSLGRASTFSVVTSLPAAAGELIGPSTSEDLELQATDLEVPALRLWRPPVAVAPAGATVGVSWTAPAADYGGSPAYGVRFQDAATLPIWTFAGAHPGGALDARLLEDSHGGALVEAHTEMPATGTSARFTYRSAAVAYRGGAGAPPSRGRPCGISTGPEPPALRSCALTDGDLVHPALPAAAAPSVPAGTPTAPAGHGEVDMGAAVPVTLVVVRGCAGCQVEGSTDGASWTAMGTVPGEPGAVEPPGGRAVARYVRTGGGSGPTALRELSVWTTAAVTGAPAGAGGPAPPPGGGGAPSATAPGTDYRPLAVGLVALALAVAALTVVLGRRRPTG